MSGPLQQQTILAEAVADFIDRLHQEYSSLRIRPISAYEDEDFALEVLVPTGQMLAEVEDAALRRCLDIEDRYDVFLVAMVKPTVADT